MRSWSRHALALAWLLLALASQPATASAAELAVVVNESNSTTSLTLLDLARVYRASRTRWPDGTLIRPCVPAPGSEESRSLAVNVFRFHSEVAVARFYLRALFDQRIASPPPRCNGTADAVRRVAAERGGLAIVRRDELGEARGVRVIPVEGL